MMSRIVIGLVLLVFGTTFGQETSLSPDARVFLESSRRAYANDKFDDAVKFAKKATQLEPGASVCQLWLGIAYSEKTQSGWFASKLLNARRCRKAFERAVELDSSSIDAREGLIEFHVRAPGVAGGNMETAWAQVEFIMQNDSMRGHLAAAYIYERKDEDTSAAETALLNAVAADTTSLLAQLRLAGFYTRQGMFKKADTVLTAAAESGDRKALLNLAWFYFGGNRSVEILRSILAVNPHDVDVLFFLAERHFKSADIAEGDSLTAAFALITGECPELQYLHAIRTITARMESAESTDDLKSYLNSEPCVQYDPCWANPHLLSGIYSHRPAWARAHLALSTSYRSISGKSKDSKKQLERALELDPTCWPARQALDGTGLNF